MRCWMTPLSLFGYVLSAQGFHSCFLKGERSTPRFSFARFHMVGEARSAAEWLKGEQLQSLLSREDLKGIISELQSEEFLNDSNRLKFDKYLAEAESKIRLEDRSISEILGPESTDTLLKSVGKIDIYDPAAVRAFLNTPAIDKMIAGILYEGIFEFIQAVDIIGNVVNRLPVIGPIRQTIVSEFKKNLNNALGGQVETFLKGFNRIAIGMMVDFVLSEENKQAFVGSNRKLVQSIIQRPASSLLPSDSSIRGAKDSLWSSLKEVKVDEKLIDSVYDSFEKVDAEDIPIDELLDASPTLERVLDHAIARYESFTTVSNLDDTI